MGLRQHGVAFLGLAGGLRAVREVEGDEGELVARVVLECLLGEDLLAALPRLCNGWIRCPRG